MCFSKVNNGRLWAFCFSCKLSVHVDAFFPKCLRTPKWIPLCPHPLPPKLLQSAHRSLLCHGKGKLPLELSFPTSVAMWQSLSCCYILACLTIKTQANFSVTMVMWSTGRQQWKQLSFGRKAEHFGMNSLSFGCCAQNNEAFLKPPRH